MKSFLGLACLAILVSAPAQARNSDAPPGDALVTYLDEVGAGMRWRSRIEAANMTILRDVEISRYGKIIEIGELRTDGSHVAVEGLLVRRRAGGGGLVTADWLEMSDPRAFMDIFSHVNAVPFSDEEEAANLDIDSIPDSHFGPVCAGLTEDGLVEYSWTARGVRLSGDADAMPDSMTRPEEIRFEVLQEDHGISRSGQDCHSETDLRFLGMNVLAVDGALGTILSGARQSISDENLSTGEYSNQEALKLDDLTLSSAGGVVSATLGSLQFSHTGDDDMDILLCDILWPHDAMDSTRMLAHALATRSGLRLGLEDIWISVPDFLPAYMIEAMGLQDLDEVTGDVHVTGSLEEGIAVANATVNFPDLLEAQTRAQLSLPQTLDVTLPGFIAEKLPLPGELLDVKIHDLSIDFADHGAGDILAALTGLSPAEHVATQADLLQVRLEEKLPPFITGKLGEARDVLVDLTEKGGRISITPETPQTILSIAMQGMMNPDGLTEGMGVSVEIRD